MTAGAADDGVVRLLRDLAPQVLGAVIRRHRDFTASEDAVQEALIAAATQWPRDGLPDNPRGWLIQVASRRLIDHVRSEAARRRREHDVAVELGHVFVPRDLVDDDDHDDPLVLLFMSCHPALSTSSAIALALRAVGGLTTAEIARAFFVPEATMAQRISRAKQSIRTSGVPFQLPSPADRTARLITVLQILYLIFNEGYVSTSGPAVHRSDLANEAIRLTRRLHRRLPDEPEVTGLLALMLLTDARRDARTGPGGELIPLDRQDRGRWNRAQVAEGVTLLEGVLPRGLAGPYQVQAAIAAIHDQAASIGDTDWPQILALYGLLRRMADSPMVALNEAIAAAMVHGPAKGLDLVDGIAADPRLSGHHRIDAVRAHLLELAGRATDATLHYRAAAARTTSTAERDYLLAQAARLDEDRSPPRA